MNTYLKKCEGFLARNPYQIYMLFYSAMIVFDKSLHEEDTLIFGIIEEMIFRILWFDMWNESSINSVFVGSVLNCIGRRDPYVFVWAFLSGLGRRHNTYTHTLLNRVCWDMLSLALSVRRT
jgi:hypothetical protein